jgi:NitT/TauT family transport system permease protein
MSAPTHTTVAAAPKRAAGLQKAFSPNQILSSGAMKIIIAFQIGLFLLIWVLSPFKILPQPGEVWKGFQNLWLNQGLGVELIASFSLNIQALIITAIISIGLAYLTVLPFFRPLVSAIGKGRFLSMVGFSLVFTLLLGGGPALKLSLLVFGMTVFFVTSMASVVAEIPKSEFDYARTLRMSEWRVVWEVVVLGTADKALEVMRQNAAIGWMMLTMVEGIYRGEGGVGALLLAQQKFLRLNEIFAIQIMILIIGLFQDSLIGFIRRLLCPYSILTLERR